MCTGLEERQLAEWAGGDLGGSNQDVIKIIKTIEPETS